MDAIKVLKESEMNYEAHKNAFSYFMFIERKRSGSYKGRGYVDGQPQCNYISKEQSSSPLVSIYALIISYTMDVVEGRHVVTCSIPSAFLQAD